MMNKGICYYTDNRLDQPLFSIVQAYIAKAGLPVVSASLKPITFAENLVIEGERSYPTMVKQIISCLERSKSKYVFFCEHDVLYSKSHFDFTPPKDDIFYYNKNVWRWRYGSGRAINHDRMLPLSSMCVNREFALSHYRMRAEKIKEMGWDEVRSREPRWARRMGYEPGTKKKKRGGFSDDDFGTWSSEIPIIDVRHKQTFSSPKLELGDFKHKPKWWKDVDIRIIEGWDLANLSKTIVFGNNAYESAFSKPEVKKQRDLSILIPARSEIFLKRTIDDILENIEADTEVIAVLDGEWSDPPIPQHERVNVIYVSEAVGQREGANLACRLSRAKYVMKLDAHCSFDKGFDRKMLEMFKVTGDNVTMIPVMRNLWAFDWKCNKCGWKIYQANRSEGENCQSCGADSKYLKRKIVWEGKSNPQSTSFCFNSTPQFKYFEDWKHRLQYNKNKKEKRYTETMSIQGSCFMLPRKKYHELNICDSSLGSWGNQGVEVACKTWLSGGRVLVNHNTWYAHLFRTNHNLTFPWPNSGRDQVKTKARVRKLLWSGKWEKRKKSVSWLVEKFWPVPGWTKEDVQKLKDIGN